MSTFDDAFEMLIGIEGGYSNDPADPGGETKYGISKRQYPEYDIRNLTLEQAKTIYRMDYWEAVRGDEINPQVAFELFEQAVNFSPVKAVLNLQRALNAFFGTELAEDGMIGLATLAALRSAVHRNLRALLIALNGEQYIHYRSLSPTLRKRFGVGWLANRVQLGESHVISHG